MAESSSLTIVLAAGEGTRMRSSLPKVLHAIAGRSLLAHVIAAAPRGKGTALAVVVGPDRQDVADEARRVRPDASVFVQTERLGTAHAVLAAREAIAKGAGDVLIAFGDTPLISAQTLQRLRAPLRDGASVVVLGFEAANPKGYGRLLKQGDRLIAIREEADATESERKVTLCNAGVMALAGKSALQILDGIGNANKKGEYYLPDAVAIANDLGLIAATIETGEDEVRGINTKAQLAEAEQVMQARLRRHALEAGVTIIAPETVFLSADTTFGQDVTIEPFVVIGSGVSIGDGAVIHAFSHVTSAKIGKNASVGPYARLRPGAVLGDGVRIGNFVEVKASRLGAGAKANHLAYIGDATVGANANIGAGTITCNYDGYDKHRTEIGEGAFVGTNTSLVAPVKVGRGAYVGSGSVITRNVPDDALALERSEQAMRPGWAKRFRDLKRGGKKPSPGEPKSAAGSEAKPRNASKLRTKARTGGAKVVAKLPKRKKR